MKQFVRALDTDGKFFYHIVLVFLALSFEKIKTCVHDGPQIRALICDQDLVRKINDKKKGAWFSFMAVMENFLDNKKANNYEKPL